MATGNFFNGFTSSPGNTLPKNAACGHGIVDGLQDALSTGNTFVANDFCTTSGIWADGHGQASSPCRIVTTCPPW